MKPRDLNIILTRLRQSAKKRGIEFDLKTTDLDEIGIPISCPILGIPLKWHNGKAE
jgi:hypothetical protein